MKRFICSVAHLLLILHYIQLVSSHLSADQVSTMTRIYEIIRNDTTQDDYTSSFVWHHVWKYSDPCSWEGVGCTPDNSSINTISFEFFSISTSEFLPFLCNISTLESLDVSENHLSSIPNAFITNCGGISGLKILNFSGNSFIGPLPTFNNGFRVLEKLDFSGNFLSGEIGLQLEGLDSLKILNLTGNNLMGPLPSFNNGFRVLEKLDFSGNSLSGEIGLQLEGLDSLKILNLNGNQFIGKIPNLGKWNLLENLLLSNNYFSGPIPIDITKHKNLSLIDLSQNQISFSIPQEFGELTKLQTLDLSYNNLIGGIPSSLSNITTLESFAAEHNYLDGKIPPLLTRHLKHLYLTFNNLTGFMPPHCLPAPNLQSVYLSFNDLVGAIPTFNSTAMLYLEMDNNRLGGSLPPSLGNLTNLQVLNLQANYLVGEIPVEIVQLTRLEWLSVGGNSLNGSIPGWLSRMHELRGLDLQGNNLHGPVPDSFANLSSLWILELGNSQLEGRIPAVLSGLHDLVILNLQGNKLDGHIPYFITNLSSLEELQLGSNQLSGEIPYMKGIWISTLNLSNNLFVGPIPSTLSTQWILEVLDLSNNGLSGEIPSFLAESTWLAQLLLMNNNLSGGVLSFGDHVLVDTSGNKDLIYPSPPVILTPQSKRKQAVFNSEIAIAVVSGFPVGLVISVIAIFISRRYKSIHRHLSPPSSILRSAIDLKRGMEAVSDPSNITHEARFSTFYKAIMPSGSTYLVKKISHSHNILKFPRHGELSEELQVLGNMSHPNVMIPKAYVLTPRRAYLFYDFARGTLHDVLHHTTGNATLDWSSRYSIAVGVAKGLAYLHECSSGPVLLLDLCTKSVLLKSLDQPQIGDVELCKFIHPSRGTESVTTAGNVYSYGVLLLELLSGKPAVSEGGAELAEWALTLSEEKSQRGKILDSIIEETSVGVRRQMLGVLEVALACVSISPEKRPNAVTVRQMLQRS